MNIRILSQEIADLDVSGKVTVHLGVEVHNGNKEPISQKTFLVQNGEVSHEYITDRCGKASLEFVMNIFEDTRKEIVFVLEKERIVHTLRLPKPQYQKTSDKNGTVLSSPKQKLSPEEALDQILQSIVSS